METSDRDWAIVSDRIVVDGNIVAGAVFVSRDKITAVGEVIDVPADMPVLDARDYVVMPGLVDMHVHINEPGRTEWEGFETATKAAAAGGVTTVVDMPLNSDPVTTSVGAFRQKLDATKNKLWVDCAFYGGVVPDNMPNFRELAQYGVVGGKAFMVHSGIDDFPAADAQTLEESMRLLTAAGLPLLAHAELDDAKAVTAPASTVQYADYLASRPPVWEVAAIEMLIDLCRKTGCHTHIVHLATAEALPLIRAAKSEGLPLTVETAPHYLFFAAEEIPDGATAYKCAPPIRDASTRQALWEAVADGTIDCIATDHSPSTPALKELHSGDFMAAWGGIASLELLLPAVWTAAKSAGVDLGFDRLSQLLSRNPCQILRLNGKGAIAASMRADLTVWDPDALWKVDGERLNHRHAVTPYHGYSLVGRVSHTVVGGRLVYADGQFADSGGAVGRPVLRA